MAAQRILACASLVAVGSGIPATAAAREVRFRSTFSGSAMSFQGDRNGDGIKAGLGIVTCRSSFGRCTAQAVGEAKVSGPAVCPNGSPGLELEILPGSGHGFVRFEKTGDLLFTAITSETVCFDPATSMQFKSGTAEFTGGTGRFAGASGRFEFEATQWVLSVDPEGNVFAAQQGSTRGTLTLLGK